MKDFFIKRFVCRCTNHYNTSMRLIWTELWWPSQTAVDSTLWSFKKLRVVVLLYRMMCEVLILLCPPLCTFFTFIFSVLFHEQNHVQCHNNSFNTKCQDTRHHLKKVKWLKITHQTELYTNSQQSQCHISDIHRKSFAHQEDVFGVKRNTEDRRFMAPERFLLAAVRHHHHLNHEVAEENRVIENKYVQTGGRQQYQGKGCISCEPTRVQIVKSMNNRSKIILISLRYLNFYNQYHNTNHQCENSSINKAPCTVLLLLW